VRESLTPQPRSVLSQHRLVRCPSSSSRPRFDTNLHLLDRNLLNLLALIQSKLESTDLWVLHHPDQQFVRPASSASLVSPCSVANSEKKVSKLLENPESPIEILAAAGAEILRSSILNFQQQPMRRKLLTSTMKTRLFSTLRPLWHENPLVRCSPGPPSRTNT
jgi:hypothetical protein